MIKMKFCDVCGQEFPPSCFTTSDVADFTVHESHPWKANKIRARADYSYFSGGGHRPDVCVECAVKLVRGIADRMERRNKREMPTVRKLVKAGDLTRFPVELTAAKAY